MSTFDALPTRLSRHFHSCIEPVEMCNTCREADATCTPEDLQAGYFARFGVWPTDGYGEPGWTPTDAAELLCPIYDELTRTEPTVEARRATFRLVEGGAR